MSTKYTSDSLHFTTVQTATLDQLTRLVEHVATLDETQDHEEPESYLAWILEHGLRLNRFQAEFLSKLLLGYQLKKIDLLGPGNSICHIYNLLALVRRLTPADPPPPGYLPPHQIYLTFSRNNNQLLDLAGFVPDDRDQGKIMGLANEDPAWIGFFCGHNVSRIYRGIGIGSLMIEHRLAEIQKFVDEFWRKPATVYAYLTNEISGKLLVERGGFQYLGERYIEYVGQNEHVFRRRFEPTPSA